MSFFTPAAAWLALLLAPLIAFYFLKLKRPKQEVASLVLWRQVLNDQRVNSPFQRFKRNILLLLQILLLLLLIFAAMQPFLKGDVTRNARLPVLIDLSASMASLDKEGGRTRIEQAKEEVTKLIDGMLPDEQMCLIGFGLTASQTTSFTDNKSELKAALKAMEPDQVPARIDDALRLAQAISRTAPFNEAVVISDGNLPGEAAVDLPFSLRFQKLDPGGPNIGITSLSARRAGDGAWEVFAQIEASDSGMVADATLWSDSPGTEEEPTKLGSDTVNIGLSGSTRLNFLVPADSVRNLRIELQPDGFDSLTSDNVAYLDLPDLRDLRAYVPESLPGYIHALKILPNVMVDSKADPGAAYDLVISDRVDDLVSLSAPVSLGVGFTPERAAPLIEEITAEGNNVVDWRRENPLLRHVDFSEVILTDLPKSQPDTTDEDFEALGYRVIAYGKMGPLILSEQNSGALRYYLLFHTDRSTLPYRLGFPIMCANLVSLARDYAGLSEIQAKRTGVISGITAAPDTSFTVEPGGQTVTSSKSGEIAGLAARQTGRFTFSGGGRQITAGASLLSSAETKLQTVNEIRTREFLAEAEAEAVKSDKPLWLPIALIALAVLLVEWWYFNRRRGRKDGTPVDSFVGIRRTGTR